MAQDFEILELSPLRGIDRNKAGGDDPDDVQLAYEAYNLAPDRRGALTMFGRLKPLHYPDAPLRISGELVGFDERGFASLAETESGERQYHLFDGDTILTSRTPGYAIPPAPDGAHIHGFGAYRSRRRFMGYDDNALARQVEPFSIPVEMDGDSGGSGAAAEIDPVTDPFIAVAVDETNSRWMAITVAGEVYTVSPLGGTWEPVGDINSGGGSIQCRTLEFGEGVWVAGGIGGTRFSDDDGVTWSAPTTATVANSDANRVVWSGVRFVLLLEIVPTGPALYISDDGDTWNLAHALPNFQGAGAALAFSEDGTGFAIARVGGSGSSKPTVVSHNGGLTWSSGGTVGHGNGQVPTGLVGGRAQEWWLLTQNGDARFRPQATTGSGFAGTIVYSAANNGNDHAKSGWFDSHRQRWYLVTQGGRVYESENGTTLRLLTDLQLDGIPLVNDYAPQVIKTSEEGVVVVGQVSGDSAIRVTNATFGLDAGTYDVYWVAGVSTESGILVVDLGHQRFVFNDEFGASISVVVPDVDSIIAGMPWVDVGEPEQVEQAEEMVRERLFVDFYVSRSAETGGTDDEVEEESPLEDHFPVLVFTIQPGENDSGDPLVPQPVTRSVPINPVGRVLGNGEPVMTMGLGDNEMSNGATPVREAIIHQGRVWGLASRDSQAYDLIRADFGETEAAEVRGGATLIFSDIGYINLMRQQSYVRLIPTESDQFVGLVSTPSGILAFFTNEAQLIAGDPIDGSLAIELYPARVGADPGTRVTKIGGVVYCIWKGDIYQVWGGQAQPLSRPAYLGEDPFVNIIADTTYKTLVAETESGKVFRYFVEFDMWFENTLQPSLISSAVEPELKAILPNVDHQGARYLIERPEHATDGEVWLVVREEVLPPLTELDVADDTPFVVWRRIDYGNKNRVDTTYGMLVPVQGAFDDGDGPVYPLLDWRILSQDTPIVTDDPFYVWPTEANQRLVARRNEDTFFFYLPRGRKSRTADLALILRGMQMHDILEPQVQVEWIPGHTSRRTPTESVIPTEGEEGGGGPIAT